MPFVVWDHVLAALFGVGMPVLGLLQHRTSPRASSEAMVFDARDRLAMYWSNSAVLVVLAGAVLLVWRLGGRTLADLGLTSVPAQVGIGLALAVGFALAYGIDTRRQLAPARIEATRARWRRDTPFMPTDRREVRHALVLVTAAAVCEEIVYRGFLVSYVLAWTGPSPAGTTLAVTLPAVLFACGHFYQGVRAVLKIAVLAGIFGAIYVVTASLWIPIALHFFVDLTGTLIAPSLLAPAVGESASGADAPALPAEGDRKEAGVTRER